MEQLQPPDKAVAEELPSASQKAAGGEACELQNGIPDPNTQPPDLSAAPTEIVAETAMATRAEPKSEEADSQAAAPRTAAEVARTRGVHWIPPSKIFMGTLRPQRAVGLSFRESEVVALAVKGFTDSQIARELVLAEETVGTHLGRISRKLNVSSRLGAAVMAYGVTNPPSQEWLERLGLTEDEIRMANALATYDSNSAIAKVTGRSISMVKYRLRIMSEKVGARGRAHLMGILHEIVELPAVGGKGKTDEKDGLLYMLVF